MIDLHCDEKNIRFRIRNSVHAGRDQDPERSHSGIGLKNVAGRLKLLYPGKFELEIREDPGEYIVELNIQP
jgi:LytS/YehU family sensor histidine kinase